jgi:hypothetical protein
MAAVKAVVSELGGGHYAAPWHARLLSQTHSCVVQVTYS